MDNDPQAQSEYELIECPNCCRKAVPFDEWDSHQCQFCGAELDECGLCFGACRIRIEDHRGIKVIVDCPECDGWGLIER